MVEKQSAKWCLRSYRGHHYHPLNLGVFYAAQQGSAEDPYDLSVQGVKKRLAAASQCASTDPTMMSLIPKQRGVKCRMEFALQKMFRI